MELQVFHGQKGAQDVLQFLTKSKRPQLASRTGKKITVNTKNGWQSILDDPDIIVTNSFLDKREWAVLDSRVIGMVKLRRNGIQDLRDRNLLRTTTLAEQLAQWRVSSERTRASVNMDGRSAANKDRVDKKVYGTPVPIFRADASIGARDLLSSRALGSPIDVTEAGEAGEAVAEEAERVLFNGDSGIVVQAQPVYGYTTLPARLTDTAANFGGGDFGTIDNIVLTFLGMLSGLSARRYHGPFGCYIADTQYHQMLKTYSDGSGQTALMRVLELPQIEFVKPSDMLADGALTMTQLTPNVVELVDALDIDTREWDSPDQTELNIAVLSALGVKLVTDASGYAGIAHATAC
jgi:hypothetical protein